MGKLVDFAKTNPQMYAMLLKEHEVPPRRTLVNLADGEVVVICQPMDVAQSTEVHTFEPTREKVAEALKLLAGRRILAGMAFDSDELSAEEQERRLQEIAARKMRESEAVPGAATRTVRRRPVRLHKGRLVLRRPPKAKRPMSKAANVIVLPRHNEAEVAVAAL